MKRRWSRLSQTDVSSAFGSVAGQRRGGQLHRALIFGGNRLCKECCPGRIDQVHCATSPACTAQLASEEAGLAKGAVNQVIQFWRAVLEILATGTVRLKH